ncbi:hypothetical protein GCM10022627_36120 [Haloarcula argentinensis]|uniref:Uncharacterized protein n=1 Tax=Haloarcula argentinensis TaxID=43776 RepID=A0A830FMB5_HALAR|nr:hypothetical protein GCM10009006_35740 [Haloarcula argentinensis]
MAQHRPEYASGRESETVDVGAVDVRLLRDPLEGVPCKDCFANTLWSFPVSVFQRRRNVIIIENRWVRDPAFEVNVAVADERLVRKLPLDFRSECSLTNTRWQHPPVYIGQYCSIGHEKSVVRALEGDSQ